MWERASLLWTFVVRMTFYASIRWMVLSVTKCLGNEHNFPRKWPIYILFGLFPSVLLSSAIAMNTLARGAWCELRILSNHLDVSCVGKKRCVYLVPDSKLDQHKHSCDLKREKNLEWWTDEFYLAVDRSISISIITESNGILHFQPCPHPHPSYWTLQNGKFKQKKRVLRLHFVLVSYLISVSLCWYVCVCAYMYKISRFVVRVHQELWISITNSRMVSVTKIRNFRLVTRIEFMEFDMTTKLKHTL